MITRRSDRMKWIALMAVPAMLLVGCSGDNGGNGDAEGDSATIELTLAHSYNPDQPQDRCGAQIIADEVNSANVGLKVELYGSSQMGGDADRVASVVSGDIDIDIQGASALGAVYEPISVLDAAYAFDDADHLAAFMASEESKTLTDAFAEETGIHALGVWSAGARHFTANTPIRTPDDLDGLRIRFPGSPQFLMNAKALGASATEVAYEELYLALQQGTVEGQENPITNIKSQNLSEVQDYLSLSSHQLNTNVVIMSSKWEQLSAEQQGVLQDAVTKAVTSVTECVAVDEKATLDEWRAGGEWEIVDNVDVDAFQDKAVAYLEKTFTGDSLEVFEAIRSTSSK